MYGMHQDGQHFYREDWIMKEYFKTHILGIIYGLILVGFTAYALLDVFVIPHSYDAISVSVGNVSDEEKLNELASQRAEAKTKPASVNNEADTLAVSEGNDSGNQVASSESASVNDGAGVQEDKETDETPIIDIKEAVSSDEAGAMAAISSNITVSTNTVFEDDFLQIDTYEDDNLYIVLNRYRYCSTYIYVAEIYMANPVLLKTAFANDKFGRNICKRTTDMAKEKGAILAINGDFYGARETGYVIRDGVLYRNVPNVKSQDLAIFEDGVFGVFNESDIKAEDVLDLGVTHILNFGPALVVDGRISVGERQEVSHASYSNPRTAVGMIEPGHYIFVVSDGRTDESKGLSLYQLGTFMQMAGCKTAYNLDGGGSSTMVFKGQLINKPCPGYGYIVERSVSDIVYIGY